MSQNKTFDTIKEAVVYTVKSFSKLVESYNSQTRVGLLYDDDPDGVCSGVILEKFLGLREIPVVERIPLSRELIPFSEEFNAKIKERRIDSLIITDLNITNFGFFENFNLFKQKFPDVDIVIFDHHQDGSDYGIEYYFNTDNLQKQISGSQFCCSKFVFEVCKLIDPKVAEYSWIKAIGIIGDSNQITWKRDIVSLIEKINESISAGDDDSKKEYLIPEEFEDFYQNPFGEVSNLVFYGLSKSSKEIFKIYDVIYNAEDIFSVLDSLSSYSEIEEEINDYIDDFNYYEKNNWDPKEFSVFEMEIKSDYDINCILSNKLSYKNPDILFMIYRKDKDGFIYASFRLQNKSINTGMLAEIANSFPEGNGGGHIQASGIKIRKDDFKEFKSKFFEKLAELEEK